MNLVERLRKWCQWQRVQGTTDNNGYPYHKHVPDCEICQAADRIEELEAALLQAIATVNHEGELQFHDEYCPHGAVWGKCELCPTSNIPAARIPWWECK